MSNALNTVQILADVAAAITSAWGSIPISYADPRVPLGGSGSQTAAPNGYAIIHPQAVEISLSERAATLIGTNQLNRFLVVGRFPFPSSPTSNIALSKVTQANSLIAALQTGPNFGTGNYGLLPLVRLVDFTERDDPQEQMFELSLTFEVITTASHH